MMYNPSTYFNASLILTAITGAAFEINKRLRQDQRAFGQTPALARETVPTAAYVSNTRPAGIYGTQQTGYNYVLGSGKI